jgi:hypothetical protein
MSALIPMTRHQAYQRSANSYLIIGCALVW